MSSDIKQKSSRNTKKLHRIQNIHRRGRDRCRLRNRDLRLFGEMSNECIKLNRWRNTKQIIWLPRIQSLRRNCRRWHGQKLFEEMLSRHIKRNQSRGRREMIQM
ncbi:hypothetical protein RJT34_25814 [Clitoria ternatea]|uniref:Uncharacterized protein n=1 Tax=Clitoria ternatea TaxID=43366 RepID=A0AAN9IIV0_CLITE